MIIAKNKNLDGEKLKDAWDDCDDKPLHCDVAEGRLPKEGGGVGNPVNPC